MAEEIITQWMVIPSTDGLYEASSNGDIRSKDRIILRKSRWGGDSSTNKKGRILKPWLDSSGYLVVYICGFGRRQAINVHRIVAYAFLGMPDGKKDVNHIDGNKKNNAASNLEWCTRKENMTHAQNTGLYDRHGKRPNNSLTMRKAITGTPVKGGDSINYLSVADAGRSLGKKGGNIPSAANGKLKQAYGYYWEYK